MSDAVPISYRYDGTFDGLLCCVFESYAAHEIPDAIWGPAIRNTTLFDVKDIITDKGHANRVRAAIPTKIGPEAARLVELTYFTDLTDKERHILLFLRKGFHYGPQLLKLLTDDTVRKLHGAVKSLLNESHLLKGFIRFSVVKNVLIASIGPRNLVLPFLSKHFRERYPEEHFMIYDTKHAMALVYRPYESAIIPLDGFMLAPPDAEEQKFRALWHTFYDAIEIKPRHNDRCRMTLMPKRFWQYMTEFSHDGHNMPLL